jgi:hypothetical protein
VQHDAIEDEPRFQEVRFNVGFQVYGESSLCSGKAFLHPILNLYHSDVYEHP